MQQLKEQFLAEFKAFEADLNGASKNSIHLLRKQALAHFEEVGFPTIQQEEWRYTNLRSVLNHTYTNAQATPIPNIADLVGIKDLVSYQIVFVDGKLDRSLSEFPRNASVQVLTFADAVNYEPELVQKHFAQHISFQTDGLLALNTAFANEGVFVHVPRNAKVDKPIHIAYVCTCDAKANLRHLVLVDENSQVEIIESYHSINDTVQGWCNTVTEIVQQQNAHLNYHKLHVGFGKAFHTGATQVHQERDSVFTGHSIAWTGTLVRNTLNSVHKGENCQTNYYGFYAPYADHLIDNHTLVDHAMPHCESNEVYKGVVSDTAKAVFNGKIMVRPDAQKTNAYQSNKNILLSETATVNAKPQLEIFADDVKCSHGATVGQLDEKQLFYLESRGIDPNTAKGLLLVTFAADVFNTMELDSLKAHLYQGLHQRLGVKEL